MAMEDDNDADQPPNYRQAGLRQTGTGRGVLKGPPSRTMPTKPSIPGKYETTLFRNAQEKEGFGGRVVRFQDAQKDIPGPGVYHNVKHHSLVRHSDSLSRKGYGAGFVSQDRRFVLERDLAWKQQLPGPANYDAPDFIRERQHRDFSTQPGHMFCKKTTQAMRSEAIPVPGPGTYDLPVAGVTGRPKVPLGWRKQPKELALRELAVARRHGKSQELGLMYSMRSRRDNCQPQDIDTTQLARDGGGSPTRRTQSKATASSGGGGGSGATTARRRRRQVAVGEPMSMSTNFGNEGVKQPFASSANRFAGFSSNYQQTSSGPGPGAHNPIKPLGTGSTSCVSSFASTRSRDEPPRDLPGPGHYDIDEVATGRAINVVQDRYGTGIPPSRVFMVTETDRFGHKLVPKKEQASLPGPGAYELRSSDFVDDHRRKVRAPDGLFVGRKPVRAAKIRDLPVSSFRSTLPRGDVQEQVRASLVPGPAYYSSESAFSALSGHRSFHLNMQSRWC
jgi:hypothetical protein